MVLSVSKNLNLSNLFNFLFKFHFGEIERKRQMTDQKDKINRGKAFFDDNNHERKFWSCLGQACSRSLLVFFS